MQPVQGDELMQISGGGLPLPSSAGAVGPVSVMRNPGHHHHSLTIINITNVYVTQNNINIGGTNITQNNTFNEGNPCCCSCSCC